MGVLEPTDAALARLDAYRARRVGQMLVSDWAEPEYHDTPDLACVELEQLDGKSLLSEYSQKQACYGTAPFDPQGARIRFFPGGITIWSGFPGAGKTTLLRQMVCHCLQRGSSVFVASLEEDTLSLIMRMVCVAAGTENPNAHQVQWFIDAFGARLKVLNRLGILGHRDLLAVIRKQAGAKGGIRHAIIDSLMCLDVSNDDFEGQRKFANLVAVTARQLMIHIHLVAHPRKLVSAHQEPDINDVAGAREIGGIADNVLFVRRAQEEPETAGATPMIVEIKKQRHGSGECGRIGGWFVRGMRQFHTEQFPAAATRYLPADAYA